MTIFAEVIGDRLEVSYSDVPGQSYRTNLYTLIHNVANGPYRRVERSRWFKQVARPLLTEINGRPC